jgi:hypothetical protein
VDGMSPPQVMLVRALLPDVGARVGDYWTALKRRLARARVGARFDSSARSELSVAARSVA